MEYVLVIRKSPAAGVVLNWRVCCNFMLLELKEFRSYRKRHVDDADKSPDKVGLKQLFILWDVAF